MTPLRSRKILVISLAALLAGCSDPKVEYFCDMHDYAGNQENYFQHGVTISPEEMCVTIGKNYCVKFGRSLEGNEQDWEKNIINSNVFTANKTDNEFQFKVFDKKKLDKNVVVQRQLIDHAWHFKFNDKWFKVALPENLANEHTFKVYELAVIDSADNGTFYTTENQNNPKTSKSGAKRSETSDPEIQEEVDRYFKRYELFEAEKLDVGNSAYKRLENYLDGTRLNYTLTFDPAKLILTETYDHPFESHPPYQFKCQIWKKQKWYQFP